MAANMRNRIKISNNPKFQVKRFHFEPAVSPVVGIMLMLTVTLILAAIISGFTGGIAKSQQKPPQLLFDASMFNAGGSGGGTSDLEIKIVSVSAGIQSRDLKLITEWRDQNVHRCTITPSGIGYPLGFDPGNQSYQYFGNYTLLAGTRLQVNGSEGLSEVLTPDWASMKEGTPIRVQFVHIPSGAIIADKEITTEV